MKIKKMLSGTRQEPKSDTRVWLNTTLLSGLYRQAELDLLGSGDRPSPSTGDVRIRRQSGLPGDTVCLLTPIEKYVVNQKGDILKT